METEVLGSRPRETIRQFAVSASMKERSAAPAMTPHLRQTGL